MSPSLILIGQYDSPFVRRVAVALQIYGMPYEHRPWSVWRDADTVATVNPLRRVPTLILDGEVLVESAAILDSLDDLVPAERALLPRTGPARRRGLRVCAFATGMADKAVSLFYEGLLRTEPSTVWVERCLVQIRGTLDLLEADRGTAPYWLGDQLSHADITVACALRFVGEAHPAHIDLARWPRLAAGARRCEELPAMAAVQQPLLVKMPGQS
jgi:glutathione S-transferase